MNFSQTPQDIIDVCAIKAGDPAKNQVRNNEWYILFKEAYRDVYENQEERWNFLYKVAAFSSTAGVQDYEASSITTAVDFDISNIEVVYVSGYKIHEVKKMSPTQMAVLYGEGTGSSVGEPVYWEEIVNSSDAQILRFVPIPDGIRTYGVKYIKKLTMPELAGTLVIPDRYMYTIVYKMLMTRFPERNDFIANYEKQYDKMVSDNDYSKGEKVMSLDPTVYYSEDRS